MVKNLPAMQKTEVQSLGWENPLEDIVNPLQHSCLENSMDRRSWQATVHRVSKSQTQLRHYQLHFVYKVAWVRLFNFLSFNLRINKWANVVYIEECHLTWGTWESDHEMPGEQLTFSTVLLKLNFALHSPLCLVFCSPVPVHLRSKPREPTGSLLFSSTNNMELWLCDLWSRSAKAGRKSMRLAVPG